MFRVLYRDLQHHITIKEPPKLIHLHHFCKISLLKSITQISESQKKSSFTVDYLINSCGLSPKTALTASTKIQLTSTETHKPDSVLKFFLTNGLTKTQISELVSKRPTILLADPDKTLKPKLEFLHGLGVTGSNLGKLISSDPTLLTRSLENQIIPSFNFLKSYIDTHENILIAFKRSTWVLQYNLVKVMEPNISVLRECGVPNGNISKLLITQPRTLMANKDRFKEIVERIKEMGFDPSSPMFFHAVRTMAGMSKSNWDKKAMVYRSFGWSDEDVFSLFKKQPFCLMVSEKKIENGVKFFMEKLKWKQEDISLRPSLLLLSLEKRIKPRCAVMEILNSKVEGTKKMKLGLYRSKEKKMKVSTVLKMAERLFVERFVKRYPEIPEVMEAYKGRIEFAGFGEVSELKF